MNEEVEAARREMEAALNRIKNTGAGKASQGLEANYGNAYMRLVRLGVVPKLRGKYRG